MIIAFGHKSRVGKDTVADMLMRYVNRMRPHMDVRRVGFAWQIKSVAAELYGWAGLGDRLHYERHPEGRTIPLPALGLTPVQIWTALGDHLSQVHPLTLPEPVLNWAPANLSPDHSAHGLLVISDLRREIEIDAVHRHGGFVVKVVRPNAPTSVSTADMYLDNYDKWDHVIVNDGTEADLEPKIITLFWEMTYMNNIHHALEREKNA